MIQETHFNIKLNIYKDVLCTVRRIDYTQLLFSAEDSGIW